MKDNHPRLALTAPAQASSTPVDLEATLAMLEEFAEQFGIERDDRFPRRMAAISFINGILLALINPESAATFTGLAAPLSPFSAAERDRLAAGVAAVDLAEAWMERIRVQLEAAPAGGTPHRRLVGFALTGVEYASARPEAAEALRSLAKSMGDEDAFLSMRLAWWGKNEFRPLRHPFLEFSWFHYPPAQKNEGEVLLDVIGGILRSSRFALEPWSMAMWANHGWEHGRRFAREERDRCREVFETSNPASVSYCEQLYRECVLETACRLGAVDLQRATLRFFARHRGGRYALLYCGGREPRTVAWAAFDFAFWMGMFSVHPLPSNP